ncbi:RNA-binding S4 domain-containing protein [Colwellia asteriadis]|uniref:RNA-binding S4 domain-containing protein n=1 Tax=Colwellia asteriadis TaxID=517723 RepID=A0ABP3WMQ0_9GAMM
MTINHLMVELDHQPIELCKLLKVANLVGGGGEAKIVISQGYVLLNGEVEYQKRKKIYHEDVIEFNGDLLQVIVNEDLANQDFSDESNEYANTVENNVSQYSNAAEGYSDVSPEPSTQPPKKQSENNKKQASKKSKNTSPLTEQAVEPTPRKRRPISF